MLKVKTSVRIKRFRNTLNHINHFNPYIVCTIVSMESNIVLHVRDGELNDIRSKELSTIFHLPKLPEIANDKNVQDRRNLFPKKSPLKQNAEKNNFINKGKKQ